MTTIVFRQGATGASGVKNAALTVAEVDTNFGNLNNYKVEKTSDTGAAILPVGPTGASGALGYIRYNTSSSQFEGYGATGWSTIGNTVGGATGTQGASGSTGITGASGTQGASGSTGITGASGVQGASGSTGITGASGVQGASGSTGITGIRGASGVQGASGSTGITGASGPGGTVTSVSALTLGTTGTDLSSTVANSTTTPTITLNIPTASSVNRGVLSASDWSTFNNKYSDGRGLGTPATGTLTYCTGYTYANLSGTVPTWNQNTSGSAASLSATLVATSGGTGQSTYAIGDLLQGSTTNTLSKLSSVATGNALISGGVTTASSWGKIGLTTHVSGTLPIANGGIGATTLLAANIPVLNMTNAFTAANTFANATYIQPMGAATQSYFWATNSSSTTNFSAASLSCSSVSASFVSDAHGTSPYLPMEFYTNNNSRGQISVVGGWGFGAANPSAGSNRWTTYSKSLDIGNPAAYFDAGSTSTANLAIICSAFIGSQTSYSASNNIQYCQFYTGIPSSSTNIGAIYTQNGTSLTFNNVTIIAPSDYRLKENVQNISGALNTISQIRPVSYDWISDGTASQGFIAHELQAILPSAVHGNKDDVDEKGNIKPQGIDYSSVIPLLTAAIQEQQALIKSLTERIAILESK